LEQTVLTAEFEVESMGKLEMQKKHKNRKKRAEDER